MKSFVCTALVLSGCWLVFANTAGAQPAPAGSTYQAHPVPMLQDAPRGPALRAVPEPMGGDVEEAALGTDCFRLQLEDGSIIVGEIAADAKLSLKSKIGPLEMNLKDVGRIDRGLQEDDFQVTLSNGDRLTGQLTFDDLKLQAAWGEVPLQVKTLLALESGKLYEEQAQIARRSVDGRTVVTVMKKIFRFQPAVENTTNPYPTAVHAPQPTTVPNWGTPHGLPPGGRAPVPAFN